MSDPLNMELGR